MPPDADEEASCSRRLLRRSRIGILIAAGASIQAQSPPAEPAERADRVDIFVEAVVAGDLDQIDLIATYTWTPASDATTITLAKVADRAAAIDEPLAPAAEPQLFVDGYSRGGFRQLTVSVDGRPCPTETEIVDRMPLLVCAGRFSAGRPVEIRVEGRLIVPRRLGAFGRHRGQLTLLGGWYPALGRPDAPPPVGSVRARVSVPYGRAVVLGGTYRAHVPRKIGRPRWVQGSRDGTSLPLIILPARTGSRPIAQGRGRWISGRRYTENSAALRQARLTVQAVAGALRLAKDEGLSVPNSDAPLLVVEAPLRRRLARAGPGVVLVSDRAFRLLPFERFYRFHRYPVVREALTALAWQQVPPGPYRHVTADAIGAFLRDRYVASSAGYAEDIFDVLSFWSFIPAVDSLLYAPQTAFTDAYFRLVDETDDLRVNLLDPPSGWPRGRILYEKLKDRIGPVRVAEAMRRLIRGAQWPAILTDTIGGDQVDAFLSTWLGPYPAMQYSLESWSSQPLKGAGCAPQTNCHRVAVDVRRTGAVVQEPIQLRLTDDDDKQRLVWSETSSAAHRTVTATLGAPLDLVELDPWGRVSETPSLAVPSPKLDNRSRAKWRVLLNSFNLQASPTAGTLDTALNLGFSQVRNVHWRFGLIGSFGPEAISVAGRTLRRFGGRVTPDRLAQWVGVSVAGSQLRSDFAGETGTNYAFTSQLFYGYDDRQTGWAPEPGMGIRAGLTYNHVFGGLSNVDPEGVGVTRDAMALTLRALRSWRIEGRHQLSLRAAVGAYVAGRPQSQLLFFLGGREAVRGYVIDADVGRYRAIVSGEWVHTLLGDVNDNVIELFWATKLGGALFADVAAIGDELTGDFGRRVRADVGYGFRIYLDYFGVRPGVMAIDIAVPLLNQQGRFEVGPPAVYIDFTQSFFVF